MSRVLEATAYPSKPQLEFGIDPTQRLFEEVEEMIRITDSSDIDIGDEPLLELSHMRPFRVGLLRKIEANLVTGKNKADKPFCDADMSFWLHSVVSFTGEIAAQGRNIRKILQSGGFATSYKKEPGLGIYIGIGLQSEAYLPSVSLFLPNHCILPVSVMAQDVSYSSPLMFSYNINFLNKAATYGINAIHQIFNSRPAKVSYTFSNLSVKY